MKFNKPNEAPRCFDGRPSTPLKPIQQLRRMVLACMLWEDSYYIDGKSSAEIIADLCTKVKPNEILELAEEASEKHHLRHVPLWLIVAALKHNDNCASSYIYGICKRPDQMTDLLSLYWKEKKCPLSKQLKKGLASAFQRFDEYQLAKYNRDGAIKLRDVLFLCHAKPKDEAQAELWKRLISNELKTPDTWEVKLSAGENKKESFQELLESGKMGKLAILRNLRNMQESGVPEELVERELLKNSRPMLPFQFIAAADACKIWEKMIDKSMVQAMEKMEKLKGTTVIFVDVSGSMSHPLSAKSKMTCKDAASGMAILLDAICERAHFFSFSDALAHVPPRRGMALRDAIFASQRASSTLLGAALKVFMGLNIPYDRLIVITDEQIQDTVPSMSGKKYLFNVQSYQYGLEHKGQWLVVNGFSEASIDYVREIERHE